MLQKISSVFIVYRRKTLTGSPDPTHANGTDKPCIIGGESGQRPNIGTETPEHKTLNNALVTTNKVLNTTCKYSANHAPSHTSRRKSSG